MPKIVLTTHVPATPEQCFELSLSVDAQTASMANSAERAAAGVTSGLMQLGDTVTWRARHFGVPDDAHSVLPGGSGHPDHRQHAERSGRRERRLDGDRLTGEHRPLLPDLDPDRFSLADMREALEEPDLTDDEIVETVTDLLNVLRGGIANLADNEAFVILID